MGEEAARLYTTVGADVAPLERGAARASAITQGLARDLEAKGRAFTAVGRSMTRGITLPILGIGIAATKMRIDFQQQMKLIETQAGASAKEVAKQTQNVLKYAQSGLSEQGPDQLAKGLYHIESLGLRGAKAMEILRTASKGAAVGQADLESTASALGAVVRTGIKGAQNYNAAMGTLNATIGAGNMRMEDLLAALSTGVMPVAKSFGITLQQVSAALATMTDEGVPANEAATRLRMTFSLLGAPSSKATKALKEIGLGSLDLGHAMRSPGGLLSALGLLKQHLEQIPDPTRRAQIVTQAFGGGRSSAGIIMLLNNLGVLGQKYDQIGKTAGRFNKDWASQTQTDSHKIAVAWAEIQADLVKLGATFAPIAAGIATDLAHVANAFDALSPKTKHYLVLLASAMAIGGPILLLFGSMARNIGALIRLFAVLRGAEVATAATSASTATAVNASFMSMLGPIGLATAAVIGLNQAIASSTGFNPISTALNDATAGGPGDNLPYKKGGVWYFSGGKRAPNQRAQEQYARNHYSDYNGQKNYHPGGAINASGQGASGVHGQAGGHFGGRGSETGSSSGHRRHRTRTSGASFISNPPTAAGPSGGGGGGGSSSSHHSTKIPRRSAVPYIVAACKKYGVDPEAALSIASVEGGLNLPAPVGDHGTSFGPFQMHWGGAMPSRFVNDYAASNAWANSPAGIDYAVAQIAKVAGGKKGRAAVEAITYGFERPADKPAEVAKAMSRYGHIAQSGYASRAIDELGTSGYYGGKPSHPKMATTKQEIVMRATVARLNREIGRMADGPTKTKLKKQLKAIGDELQHPVTAAQFSKLQSELKKIAGAYAKALSAAKNVVSNAKGALGDALDALASQIDDAFDKVTQKTLDSMQIMVQGPNGGFLYGGGITDTPAGRALAAMQRQDTVQGLNKNLSDAQANLASLMSSGTASSQDIIDAQNQVADAQRAIQEDALGQQAQAQQDAADKQLADAQQAYQDQRDLQKVQMDAKLADLKTQLESGKITWKQYLADTTALMTQEGIPAFSDIGATLGAALGYSLNAALDEARGDWNILIQDINKVRKLLGEKPLPLLGTGGGKHAKPAGGGGGRPAGGGIQPMARGGYGIARRPTLFLAGEAGDEAFWFGGANGKGPGFPGGGGDVHLHVHGTLVHQNDLEQMLVRTLTGRGRRNVTVLTGPGVKA